MLAAMNGGMGGGWNNPFAYMMMLGMFRFMYGDGWNGQNGNVQRSEIQSQIDSLRTQMSDNHNSDLLMGAIQGNNQDLKTLAANLNCDFNALQSSVCGIQAGIQQISGQVGYSAERVINAISQGNLQMTIALKDCCCQTQQNIIKMGYDNQLGRKYRELNAARFRFQQPQHRARLLGTRFPASAGQVRHHPLEPRQHPASYRCT